jgi:hypothetical protein
MTIIFPGDVEMYRRNAPNNWADEPLRLLKVEPPESPDQFLGLGDDDSPHDSIDKRQRKYVDGRSREIVHSRCGARVLRLVC